MAHAGEQEEGCEAREDDSREGFGLDCRHARLSIPSEGNAVA